MKPDLSIILPVFNEEKNVPLIAEKYAEIAAKYNVEVIIVEDTGSKDNTRQALTEIAKTHPFIKPLFTTERGYGISVFNGLKAAQGEFVSWTHADLQCDPHDVVKAYELIKKQPHPEKCYIKGDRKKRKLFDQFFTTGMSAFETFYLGTILHDINAQPNMFHHSFLSKLPKMPHDFSFDLAMLYLAKRLGMDVIRFPVLFTQRLHGASSWNTGLKAKYKFIKRTLDFSFKLNPLLREQGHPVPSFFKRYWNLGCEFFMVPFIRFCFFGGISTIINYGLFFILFQLLGINYLLASGIGYTSGVLFSFPFNRSKTFKAEGNPAWHLFKYFSVYTFSLLVNIALLYLFVDLIGILPLVAKVLVIIVTTLTNFFGCKHVVFRKRIHHDNMPQN